MRLRIIFLFLIIAANQQTSAQTIQKNFDLFSIRVDKKGCWFIPTNEHVQKSLGAKEINFEKKIFFYEKDGYMDYGINVDGRLIINDSMLQEFGYGYNIPNTTMIEIVDDKLMISIPGLDFDYFYLLKDNQGNNILDSNGEYKRVDLHRNECVFLLFDLKNMKMIVEDTTIFMNRKTSAGYLVERSDITIADSCSNCKFSFYDFNGYQKLSWLSDVDIVRNDSILKLIYSDGLFFYGNKTECRYQCDLFFYIDINGISHQQQFSREEYFKPKDFYFTDYYRSHMQNDTIYVAGGELITTSYAAMKSPISFDINYGSVGVDIEKENIPFDTSKLFIMDYSDFYVTASAPKYYAKVNGEVWDIHYNEIKDFDSKDSLDNGIHFIDQNFTGFLNIYNHKLKKMIDFKDQYLVDFNDKYFLVAKRIITQNQGKVKMSREYFIYDRKLDLIKTTLNKSEFYKM